MWYRIKPKLGLLWSFKISVDWKTWFRGKKSLTMTFWEHSWSVKIFFDGWVGGRKGGNELWELQRTKVCCFELNWGWIFKVLKSRNIADKRPSSQSYGFSSSYVWMWELDHKEGWSPKNWCFWTVVLEKTLESSLDYKDIKPVNPEGNQSWTFIGATNAEAPILWPPDVKNWLIGLTGLNWLSELTPWCWERLKAGGEGDNRGWDGWMASLTCWTWVWVSSGS